MNNLLDEFRSTSVTWDKATRRIYSPVTANESDSNGRKLNIQVVNSGQVENLTGATLHLYWETKDKAQYGLDAFTASDISKGEFEIFYTTGMLSNVGELNATLVLVDTTGKVVSDWFKITVARGIDESAIQSENSFSTLTQALIDVSILEKNYEDLLNNPSNPPNQDFTPIINDLTAQIEQNKEENDLAIKTFRDFTVSITDFGAVYDDPSFDNMPIIALAQDYVVANGGGTIYFPNNGTLYVKPFLRMKSGVNLLGANSRPVIKVAPDVTNFYGIFLIEHVKHVKIRNLTIDSNKESRSNYDISVLPQILISLAEAEYIDVEHNTLIGNGVWTYACFTGGETQHSRHLKLNHNHIVWKAGLSSDKVGPGSQVDVDNTTIYFDAIDYEVIGNYIETADGVKNMTCIEQHGANAVLRDNYIDGFRCGLIVWSIVANTPNVSHVKDNNLDVINNTFVNVETGITNGATSNITYGDFDLTNVKIHDNKILLDSGKFDRPSSRGIEIYLRTEGTTLVGRNIEIENNIIDSLPSSRTFADPTAVYNFTGISVLAGRLSGIKVKNNTIRNIHGIGLMVGGGHPEKLFLSDSVIEGNIFIDCGKGGNITFDGFQHRTGITIQRNANSVLERVHIGRNFIYDTKPSGTYLTRAANGLIAIDEDQIVMSKTREQWTGSFKGAFRVQADISNAYINTGTQWDVTLTKDRCKITAYAYIATTYTGQGLYVHLPYEANITEDTVIGKYMHYKASGEVVTGFFRIYASGKKVAHFMYPGLRATDLAVGDRLQFDIDYPVSVLQKYIP